MPAPVILASGTGAGIYPGDVATITPPSGVQYVVVAVNMNTGTADVTATLGGNAMALLGTRYVANGVSRHQAWFGIATTSTSAQAFAADSVAAPGSMRGAHYWCLDAVPTFRGQAQQDTTGLADQTALSVTITASADDLVLAFAHTTSATTLSADAPTVNGATAADPPIYCRGLSEAGAASVTVEGTWSAATSFVATAISLEGAATASAARPSPQVVAPPSPSRRVRDVGYLALATFALTTARQPQPARATPVIVSAPRVTAPPLWMRFGLVTASYQGAPIEASGGGTIGAVDVDATAQAPSQGAATATIGGAGVVGAGSAPTQGNGTATIGGAAVVGAGALDNTVTGTGTATLGALGVVASGSVADTVAGTGAASIGSPSAVGAGNAPTQGAATATIGGVDVNAQDQARFRGTLRATLSLGPWLFATITLSPGDTMSTPALALDALNYVDATNLKNRRTGTALDTGDVTGFAVTIYAKAGRREVATTTGTVESATRCYAELTADDLSALDEGERYDVAYTFTLAGGESVTLWDLNVVAGRVEA